MTTQDILQRNKQNVQAFYDLMFNQSRPAEAIATYAGESFRQHNPHVGDGKQAFIDYFERMAAEYPLDRDSKVVEHWDVLQVIPEASANQNGMF